MVRLQCNFLMVKFVSEISSNYSICLVNASLVNVSSSNLNFFSSNQPIKLCHVPRAIFDILTVRFLFA